MQIIKRSLIVIFSLSFIPSWGASNQKNNQTLSASNSSSSSSSSSSSQPVQRFKVNLSPPVSLWVDPKIIEGVFGLEALFTPKEFFSNYHSPWIRNIFELQKYIDSDLEKHIPNILYENDLEIVTLYKLFEAIKTRPDMKAKDISRFIDNSIIGKSVRRLNKAKSLIDQGYFHVLFNTWPIVRNLSSHALKKRLRPRPNGTINKPLFSPRNFDNDDTKIEETLIWLIDAEKESICIASYSFTNAIILQALHRAKDRGVKIFVVVDHNAKELRNYIRRGHKGGWHDRTLNALADNEFYPFMVWNKAKDMRQMHHKFILFRDNVYGMMVAHGSYNLSHNANYQPENMIFTNDMYLYRDFLEQFIGLMRNSIPIDYSNSYDDSDSDDDARSTSASSSSSSESDVEMQPADLISQALDNQLSALYLATELKRENPKRRRQS